MQHFDVIVVGGGHAGTEAAAAAARRGARVALLTHDRNTIGAMSCNPAIGGLGKGHIVREVDALDGIMAVAADRAAIHYRMLNRSKGSAVQGPRVQADRTRYAAAVRDGLSALTTLTIIDGDVERLLVGDAGIHGVALADGTNLHCSAVVLATGTFLGGRMFRGEDREEGGRVGERAARPLGKQLRALSLPIARLKTGTPPRLDGRTIDWGRLVPQPSDAVFWTMSPMSPGRELPQLACAGTRTNTATHDIIRAGLARSPLFGGAIAGQGPRYCPSIEDKVHRFGDRDGHQIFLEPEGLDTSLVYPNGISTSLPVDVQLALVRSIVGLEAAEIVTPGYAVEYDYCDPRALDARLACADLPGLFLAGQINGTTGYEEAAGQGLVAGANAAAFACDLAPLLLDRSQSYVGVMIDDLTLQGVTEPYRMLTARAEYRLHLRADNADTRLGGIADAAGLLSEPRRRWWSDRMEERERLSARLEQPVPARMLREAGAMVGTDAAGRTAAEWLRIEGITVEQVAPEFRDHPAPDLVAEVADDARYAPYLARQAQEVAAIAAEQRIQLPESFAYSEVRGLSNEMVERLSAARPGSLGAASRIRGITPAALTAILMHARRKAA